MRIVITGTPDSGKTTFALLLHEILEIPTFHTDDMIGLGWKESADEVSKWFDQPGPWILEGVTVTRALRRWRDRNPEAPPPFDRFILFRTPKLPLRSPQARGMATRILEASGDFRSWIESGARWIER